MIKTLLQSSGFQKYASNTGFLFLEKIIRAVMVVTVWAMVVRYLGPERFGLYSYALSFVFLFNLFSDLGLEAVVVRDLVHHAGAKNQILTEAFFLKLIGSFLAFILISLCIWIFSIPFYTAVMVWIMSLRMFFQTADVIDFYFQSKVASKYVTYAQLFSLFVTSLIYIFLIYIKAPLIAFAEVLLLEAVLICIGLIFLYELKKVAPIKLLFNWDRLAQLFRESWPLALSGVAISIYMRIDQIMIKNMLGVAAVGYYSAAVKISEGFYFIPMLVTASLFPAIVNAKKRDEVLYLNRLEVLFSVLVWLAIGFSLSLMFLAGPLIKILFGQAYLPAAQVLVIHVWAGIFVFLGVARSKWMITEKLQIYTLIYAVAGAVFNIILNLFLIPKWGINGAAIATVISQFFATSLSNLFSRKTRDMFFLQLRAFNPMLLFDKSII